MGGSSAFSCGKEKAGSAVAPPAHALLLARVALAGRPVGRPALTGGGLVTALRLLRMLSLLRPVGLLLARLLELLLMVIAAHP